MSDTTEHFNGGDGWTAMLVELTKTVTSVAGKLDNLSGQVGQALAMRPELDALQDRVLVLETKLKTVETENKNRMDRLWQTMQAMTIGVGILAVIAGGIYFAFDHFRLK